MKRGKEDEKVVGPMFPRLHVNDKEKGGPRAPPRNKMALYEQLSIPSQRFNPAVLPLNPDTSTNNNTAPPPSSSQGTGPERNYGFPVHLPSQIPSRRAEKYTSRQSDGPNLNASLAKFQQRKKVDDDDFRVPVYVQSRTGQSNDKNLESFDGKRPASKGSRYVGCSIGGQNGFEGVPKLFSSPFVNMRKDVRNETKGFEQISPSKEQTLKSVRNTNGENVDTLLRQAKLTPNHEYQDCPLSKPSRLRQCDTFLQRECEAGSQSNDIGQGDGLVESTRETDKGNAPSANQTSPAEAINDTEYHDTRTGNTMKKGNLNKSGNVSKISRLESLSTLKITPDDVVEIIGQKRFWKARNAIASQQRLFAVQVFELHRLIKVQQLIAGSPDLLVEDGAFLGKSRLKGSTPKKLSLEYVVKPRQQTLKRKHESEKLNHKMECSAENAVGKPSLSSMKYGSQHSNYTPFDGNPHHENVAADSGMPPWCFHQSPGHQWLIPVMSPSEGLVYKPYPGPGFTGTTCGGGCGPFGPTPLGGTFMNALFGVPASHQENGVPPNTPLGSHPYFPTYGMPIMNAAMSESAVEQVKQFSAQGSYGQNVHSSGRGANVNENNPSSCDLPVQRNGAVSLFMKHQASREVELQGSKASSPSEMAQGIGRGQIAEGRDALPLYPMAPAAPEGVPQSLETVQQTRVIKVVPHNRRSATESAARIFKSIQEERKQYDIV
ncbi:hypothetical protein RIF29_12597 [Crotalaria pallida]|uniref:Protein EARLY FLOWERING 3 n=1 Tax=Crotalaria pallida TaxID=3830 RepID=A0AAN9P141_CROPI